MSEGRKTEIILLDDQRRKLAIVVQPRLYVQDLLNIVASHCSLRGNDKQYFGLAFCDDSSNLHWLQPDRRVLEHEFPKKSIVLTLFHFVKFYVHSLTQLHYVSTVQLFYQQARLNVLEEKVQLDTDTHLQLGAMQLHLALGDYTTDSKTYDFLRKVKLVPEFVVKNLGAVFDQTIIEQYKQLKGFSKGQVIVDYLSTVEASSFYGVHLYDVKDKTNATFQLTVGPRGIAQYDVIDPQQQQVVELDETFGGETPSRKPKRSFPWKHMENLYYRDRKFTVEIYDPKRNATLASHNHYDHQNGNADDDELTNAMADPSTLMSMSRRSFAPSNVRVHHFFCHTPQLCKTLWAVAISQHQFYLDQRQIDSTAKRVRRPDEIARELNNNLSVIRAGSNESGLCSSVSTQSLQSLQSVNSSEKTDEEQKQEMEALRERKIKIQMELVEKLQELRKECIKEGELTGQLPPEIQKTMAPGESLPVIQRRVGTAFQLSSALLSRSSNTKADQMAQLETQIELQAKIIQASQNLLAQRDIGKSIKKKRLRDYEDNKRKLQRLKQDLHNLRMQHSSSKPDLSRIGVENGGSRNIFSTPTLSRRDRIAKSAPASPTGSIESGINVMSSMENATTAQVPYVVHHSLSFPDANVASTSSSSSGSVGGKQQNGANLSTSVRNQQAIKIQQSGTNGRNRSTTSDFIASLLGSKKFGQSQQSLQSNSSTDYDNVQFKNCQKSSVPASMAPRLTNGYLSSNEDVLISLNTNYAKYHSVYNNTDFIDCNKGQYNVANQRASWNYQSTDLMSALGSSMESLEQSACSSIGDSGCALNAPPPGDSGLSASSSALAALGKPPHSSTARLRSARSNRSLVQMHGYGSLDRRMLKMRNDDPVMDPQLSIARLDRSPTRYQGVPQGNRPSPAALPHQAQSERIVRRASYQRKYSTPDTFCHDDMDVCDSGRISSFLLPNPMPLARCKAAAVMPMSNGGGVAPMSPLIFPVEMKRSSPFHSSTSSPNSDQGNVPPPPRSLERPPPPPYRSFDSVSSDQTDSTLVAGQISIPNSPFSTSSNASTSPLRTPVATNRTFSLTGVAAVSKSQIEKPYEMADFYKYSSKGRQCPSASSTSGMMGSNGPPQHRPPPIPPMNGRPPVYGRSATSPQLVGVPPIGKQPSHFEVVGSPPVPGNQPYPLQGITAPAHQKQRCERAPDGSLTWYDDHKPAAPKSKTATIV